MAFREHFLVRTHNSNLKCVTKRRLLLLEISGARGLDFLAHGPEHFYSNGLHWQAGPTRAITATMHLFAACLCLYPRGWGGMAGPDTTPNPPNQKPNFSENPTFQLSHELGT